MNRLFKELGLPSTVALLLALALPVLLVVPALLILLVLAFDASSLSAAWSEASGSSWSRIGSITLFSLLQAFLSTVISVIFGLVTALALYRRSPPFKRLLLAGMGLAFILPALVVVFAILGAWGRSGLFADIFSLLFYDLSFASIFGLGGILLAHVFFNFPFVARVLWRRLDGISSAEWQLAREASLSQWATFRALEWPMIRRELPNLARLVFLYCMVSFAIIWILGGGPRATTLELAIFQHLRLDIDLSTAARLALIQLALVVGVIFAAPFRMSRSQSQSQDVAPLSQHFGTYSPVHVSSSKLLFAWDYFVILFAAGFLFLPLLSLFFQVTSPIRALGDLLALSSFWAALGTSFSIALASALISVALAVALMLAWVQSRAGAARTLFTALPFIGFAFPAFFIGAGWLILLTWLDLRVSDFAFWLLIFGNAFASLCIASRCLEGEAVYLQRTFIPLKRELGIGFGVFYLRLMFRRISPSLWDAFLWCFALSFGDLGLIALFGGGDFITIPLLLKGLMGSYRSEASGVLVILLLVFYLVIFLTARERRDVRA